MKKHILILIIILLTIFTPLFSASPTIRLGLDAGSLLLPDEKDLLYSDWLIMTDALFSYRDTLSGMGYYSLFSSVSAGFTYTDPYLYSDEEVMILETGFYFKNSKLICIAGIDSSFSGTYEYLPYYNPEWEFTYFFITKRKEIQPFVTYRGSYSVEPESNNDTFYEGGEFGIVHRPGVTTEYSIRIGAGWETWPEYPVYSTSGSLSDTVRNDLLCIAEGKLKGIYNFFFDWEIILSAIILFSNANDYIEEIYYMNERSEDRIVIRLETNFQWSPSRYIHIELYPFFSPEIYLNKQTLDTGETLKSGNVRAYTIGGNFHFDWTPDNKLYILCETESTFYFSEYTDQLAWNTLIRFGLEYSLVL